MGFLEHADSLPDRRILQKAVYLNLFIRHRRHIGIIGIPIQLHTGVKHRKLIVRQHHHIHQHQTRIPEAGSRPVDDLLDGRAADHMPVQTAVKGKINDIFFLSRRQNNAVPHISAADGKPQILFDKTLQHFVRVQHDILFNIVHHGGASRCDADHIFVRKAGKIHCTVRREQFLFCPRLRIDPVNFSAVRKTVQPVLVVEGKASETDVRQFQFYFIAFRVIIVILPVQFLSPVSL